jgi:hypothetical protein
MTQDDSAVSGPRTGRPAGRWYLRAGLLIDGNGGPPLRDGSIVIEDVRSLTRG